MGFIALTLKDAQDDKSLDDLFKAGFITDEQYSVLRKSHWIRNERGSGRHVPVKSRSALLLQFIRMELNRAYRRGLVSTTVLSNLMGQVDAMAHLYASTSHIAWTYVGVACDGSFVGCCGRAG
eukprot:m.37598 g.37598  ORF g.37598 m.37598 type:complete len:123 (-) comp5843_c0_seq4:25-393(-)